MEQNKFYGKILWEIFGLRSLRRFNISANNFTDEILISISNCSSLRDLLVWGVPSFHINGKVKEGDVIVWYPKKLCLVIC